MPHVVVLRLTTVVLLVMGASPAVAQPEFWSVSTSIYGDGSLSIHDLQSGELLTTLAPPAGFSVCGAAMSPDRRWYFVATNLGIVRIDVAKRVLVELIPISTGCGASVLGIGMWISPSGRWWHIFDSPRLLTIDSVTRQTVSRELPGEPIIQFDALGTTRYELTRTFSAGWRSVVESWPDGPANAALWVREFPDWAGDVAVGPGGVYVAVSTAVPGHVELLRLDATTGAEIGRVEVTLTDPDSRPDALAVVSGRLFLSASNFQTLVFGSERHTLASFDAMTLAPIASVDGEDTARYGPFYLDAALAVGYIKRLLCYRFTCFTSVQSFDPLTLTSTTALGFGVVSSFGGGALGEAQRPRPVRLDGLASANQIDLAWQPDASSAISTSFDILGARRGEPLQWMATLDGAARSWTASSVPSGSFTLGVVARNANGASDVSRVDLGVAETALPDAPANLSAGTSADVARLVWQPPASDPVPSDYVVEAAPAGASEFVTAAETTRPELFRRVPIGQWQVRVRARTAGGLSAPSNVVALTSMACSAPPGTPSWLASVTSANVVTLQWREPLTGPPLEYVLEVGIGGGLPSVAQVALSGARPDLQIAAPSGSYLVRVRARNDCGESAASNDVVVFVP